MATLAPTIHYSDKVQFPSPQAAVEDAKKQLNHCEELQFLFVYREQNTLVVRRER